MNVSEGPIINSAQSNRLFDDMRPANNSTTGVNADDASVNYQPVNEDSGVVKSAETLAFDLTASANSATQMAQLFLELIQSLRGAAETRAEMVIQQMETQVEVKRNMAQTMKDDALSAKQEGDAAVVAQYAAAAVNIAGACLGASGGAFVVKSNKPAFKDVGVQGGSTVASLMTTGTGGSAGLANAEATNQNNQMTKIQEDSKAKQTESDAEAQLAATIQQRAANWESSLNEIQNALLALAKELFAQAPNTMRSMGNNI